MIYIQKQSTKSNSACVEIPDWIQTGCASQKQITRIGIIGLNS